MSNKGIELPDGWVSTRFGDISYRITKGSTPTSYGFSYKDEGIKFIKTENIDKNGRINTISTFIDDEADNFLNRSKLEENDLLFSIAGTIGRAGIVGREHLPANTNQALAIIRCPWKYIDNKYLFHFLQSPTIQSTANKKKVGVGRANISLTDISGFPLYLPPLPEQHRIVSKIEELFTKLDAGVEALKMAKAQLNRYRQAILKSAFEGKLTEEWREKNEVALEPVNILIERILRGFRKEWEADLLAKYKAKGKKPPKNWENRYKEPKTPDTTDFPMLPKGWKWVPAKWTCDIKGRVGWKGYKKSDLRDKGPYVLGATHLTNRGKINLTKPVFISIEKYHESPEIMVNTGDIIIAQRGSLGKLAIVDYELGEATINPCVLLMKDIKVLNKFLLYLLLSPRYQNVLIGGNTSTTTPMITQEFLKNMVIPLPTLNEQHKIVEEIERMFFTIEEIEVIVDSELKRNQSLYQSILKHAFQGKLVPQDPTDEPASKLLERIKAEKTASQKTRK